MAERAQIVERWRRGGTRVLATIVRIEGSSYRRPGARLLLADAGNYAGNISGGCLEAEIVRKAEWKIRNGAVVERYSTAFDDTSEIPYGLGCGGVVDVLLEPVGTPECDALFQAMEQALAGKRAKVVTWLPTAGRPLARVILSEDGEILFASEGLTEKKLLPHNEADDCFVEDLRGPQRLIVAGAGDDAKPLTRMAKLIGWHVIVIEGRSWMAQESRFPEADQVICANSCAALELTVEDAVVVMTHSYEQDLAFMTELLPLGPRYLGLLGARHRSSLLVSQAASAAGLSLGVSCERVWAPVGLDLGGDGPEAIALAIVAEIQAICMGRVGLSKRLKVEDVESSLNEEGTMSPSARCSMDVPG